jgi:hypothetical protein
MPESKGSKGYLIPADPQPSGFRCIGLLIPDDDYYLYAMQGAYEELTHWYKWEKDGTNRASLAAAAWADAYEKTMDCYWQKDVMIMCGEDKLDEMIVVLQEIRDAIIANSGSGIVDVLGDLLPILLAGNVELATLVAVTNSIDNVLGGEFEP